MKKFKKVCMILMSVTIVAGIGCIIAAFVMGADPRQMKSNVDEKDSHKVQTQKLNLDAAKIRKLDIDIGSGNVKIQNSDQDQLIIKKKGNWKPIQLKPDGEIKIEQESKHFQLAWFQTTSEITVILPKGVTFDEVSMDCGSGDIETDSLNITRKLSIDCGSGDIRLGTVTAVKTEFDVGSGDVTVMMPGNENDYNYDLDCGSGDIRISDTLIEDDFKKNPVNAFKWIEADCGSGNITIDFDNEV